ncbi:MAG: rod shape-determining protein [Clostridia bacterium]|nr:rod shape-determining protein [Clostridia bacterium]
MAYVELALDIGAVNTYLGFRKNDIAKAETSVVAVSRDKGEVLAVGNEADKLYKEKPYEIKCVYPFNEGTVVDSKMALVYLQGILDKYVRNNGVEPQIAAVCSVCCGCDADVRKSICDVLGEAKIGPISLIETPLSAYKTIQRQFNTGGGIIVDIGHSKTDIGLVYDGKMLNGATLMLGSKHIDMGISIIVEELFGASISLEKARFIKEHCAGLVQTDGSAITVEGKDIKTGMERSVKVKSSDIYPAVCDTIGHIALCANAAVNSIPEDAREAVRKRGVFLCGGGAKLVGIDTFISERLNMPVRIPKKCDMSTLFGLML